MTTDPQPQPQPLPPLPAKVRSFLASVARAWAMSPGGFFEVVYEPDTATLVLSLCQARLVTKWIGLDPTDGDLPNAKKLYVEMAKEASVPLTDGPAEYPIDEERVWAGIADRMDEPVTIEVDGAPVTRSNAEWVREYFRLEAENRGLEGDGP